jgi:hypothetical protein
MVILVNGISPTMFPTPSSLLLKKIDLDTVKEILGNGFVSAIGHQSTAEILTQLIGIQVQVNRVNVKTEYGDVLVVFSLKSRPPEGKILTREEIEQLGYEFYSVSVER